MLDSVSYSASLLREAPLRPGGHDRVAGGRTGGLLALLRRQALSIGVVTGFVLGLGLLYATLAPPRYRSVAVLLVDARGLAALQGVLPHPDDAAKAGAVDSAGPRALILPRSILEATVTQAGLADNPLFGGGRGALAEVIGASRAGDGAAERTERAIIALAQAVEVVRGDPASTLDIVVTTGDARVSADVANAVARAVVARAEAGGPGGHGRLDELRRDAEQAEAEVETFRARNNLPPGTPAQLGTQQLSELTYQLTLARTRTAEAQAKVTQIDQMNRAKLDAATLPEVIQSPVIGSLRAQYARLVQQEASMSTELGSKHPALIQLQEQMRQMRGLIVAEIERIAQGARADLARAQANEAALQHSIDALGEGTAPKSPALARLRELERAADAKRTLYQSLAGSSTQADAHQGAGTSATRIISEAVPAWEPDGPPLALVLAGALMFGLGAGIGVGILRESGRDTVTTQAALAAATGGLPILAVYRNGRPGAAALESEAGASLMGRLCPPHTGSRVRLIALVGLHHDPLRSAMLHDLAETAHEEGFRLKQVICAADAGTVRRRGRAGRDTVSIVELMRREAGPPTVRRLRQSLMRFGGDSDIVLLDTPPLLDAGMPPALLQAADAVVLVVAPGDLDSRSLATLCAHVEASSIPAIGIILDGEIELA